jgi:ABC-type transport system involved in multi-copper enzyme maturation permease subunit
MSQLIRYEFRKIWSQVTILAVISLILISSVLNFIFYLDSNSSTITSDGTIVKGIKSYRTLKNESKNLEGVIDQDYLDNLIREFNVSIEKKDFEHRFGSSSVKYEIPNLFINFVNYSEKMTNFTMGLDFDFIKSEEDFYKQYKKSVSNLIQKNNERNWFKYTDKQMNLINEKIEKIETPIKVEYSKGLANFIYAYGEQYWLILVVLVFALSSIFSNDSNNGIDELILSSEHGRKNIMNAKLIAGNIFSLVVYLIFVAIHLIEHGLAASLHGWGQSVQNHWHSCLYNINFGTGILIMLGLGLLGVLVVTNLIMMVSIKIKFSKLSTFISVGTIWGIINFTHTANPIQLQLNPIYFAKRLSVSNIVDFDIYYFLGNKMIPYSMVSVVLGLIYILIISFFTIISYKKYKLN